MNCECESPKNVFNEVCGLCLLPLYGSLHTEGGSLIHASREMYGDDTDTRGVRMDEIESLKLRDRMSWKRVFATVSPIKIYFADDKYLEKLRMASHRNGRHCYAVRVDGKTHMCWLPLVKD